MESDLVNTPVAHFPNRTDRLNSVTENEKNASPILIHSNNEIVINEDKYFYTIESKLSKSDYESEDQDQQQFSRPTFKNLKAEKRTAKKTRTDSSSDNSDSELKKLSIKIQQNQAFGMFWQFKIDPNKLYNLDLIIDPALWNLHLKFFFSKIQNYLEACNL